MHRTRGFTLIEVLVALAIIAISLAAGAKAAGALTESAARLDEMTSAQWCAENQLTELRLSGQLPDIGDAEYSCQQLGRSFRGVMEVRPTPNPNFRRVDAVVLSDSGQRLLNITTIMGRR